MRGIATSFLILFTLSCLQAQINPAKDIIYNPDVVATIRIVISQEDKDFLYDIDSLRNEEYVEAQMRFTNEKIDTNVGVVGLRLRGNTSRSHPKKSFKIKFKEFGGEKFYNYKKFNLKAENNDPSLLREHNALRLYRSINVPAARSHFVKVYLNEEYMGLYLNVEQIDDEFTDTRFDSEEGNLYKCAWGASLTNQDDIYDENVFELETNKGKNDRSKLANAISVLNDTEDENFESELRKVVNVGSLMRFFAAETLLGHWDGYAFNKNNFYIYENPKTDKLEFIPYDIDNSFGINWIPLDWAERDLLNWSNENDNLPLFQRTMEVEKFKTLYLSALWLLLEGEFAEENIFPQFEAQQALISDAVREDSYYPETFGYSFSDFENSMDEEVVKHAPYGLKPYVSRRSITAAEQIPYINSIEGNSSVGISLYPSITTKGQSIFITDLTSDEIQEMTITSSSGGTVSFTAIQGTKTEIKFEQGLSAGLYFISTSEKRGRFIAF